MHVVRIACTDITTALLLLVAAPSSPAWLTLDPTHRPSLLDACSYEMPVHYLARKLADQAQVYTQVGTSPG